MKEKSFAAMVFLGLLITLGCGGSHPNAEKMYQAIKDGDVEMVKTLLKKDPSCANMKGPDGMTSSAL